LEAATVVNRKMFVDWHAMDSKAWRPEFIKRYPERELINDEITVMVRDLCSERQSELARHLLGQWDKISKELNAKADQDPAFNARMARNGVKMIEDAWHEYRMRYLEKEAPKLGKEVRAAVKKMYSIQRLKTKVEAAAPPQQGR